MRNAITNPYSDSDTCAKSYSYTKGAPESAAATVVAGDNGRGDRRARRKANFPNKFAFDPRSERRRQVRDGEVAIASTRAACAPRRLIAYLSFLSTDAKMALHS